MVLTKLQIEKKRYGPNEGKYAGVAQFTGTAGDVVLNLTPEMCDKIFLVCADGIMGTAKEAAENLTCNVIEHRAALEGA
jgi:hypothetical protein